MLMSEWCHPPIPTGRNDRGRGGTVGGGTVGAWRPRASIPRRMIIGEKGDFQRRGVYVQEAWGRGSTRHRQGTTGTKTTHERATSQGVICMHGT